MDDLAYLRGHYYDFAYIHITRIQHTNSVKFNEIRWNTIEVVYVYIYPINKQMYNFILKLPIIKFVRFINAIGDWCLITYNTKFFKHKLLRMGLRGCGGSKHYRPNIIFIL